MESKILLENKIKKLEALLNSSKLLNSTQDTQYILNSLIEESISYIKNANAGIIFLYNEKNGYLEPKAYYGFNEEVGNVKLKPGESISGLSFQRKKSFLLRNTEEIAHFTSTMRPNNISAMQNTYSKIFPTISSTISCPLIFQNKCFGVVVVDSFVHDGSLTENDLSFLEGISIQASIAINNAINYEKELASFSNLEKYSKIIETQKQNLSYTIELHNKLTDMILQGSTVHDIIEVLSNLLNKDVIVIDLLYNIKNYVLVSDISFSSIKKSRAKFSQILSSKRSSKFYFNKTEDTITFFPIIVNKDNLGWLGIVNKKEKDSEIEKITIERVTTILSIELLKSNEIDEIERKLKGDFFDSLYEYKNLDYINKCVTMYGYNTSKQHRVLVLKIESSKNINSDFLQKRLFIPFTNAYYDKLSKSLLQYYPNTISFLRGNELIFIIELNKISIKHFNNKAVKKIMDTHNYLYDLYKSKFKYEIGVSNTYTQLRDFRQAYLNANQAIKIGRQINNDSFIVLYDELKVKKFLLNNDVNDLKMFVSETLGSLIDYKGSSNNDFLDTLKVYIKSNNNWSYTKDKLYIHGNTLTYRLKRIEDILKIKLDNYDQKLNIQIAIEILELFELYKEKL